MSRSDLKLRYAAMVVLPLVAAFAGTACSSGDDAPEAPPQTPNVTLRIEPLTDAELMGVPREQVLLTLPWSEQVVSSDPSPVAARATLQSVDVSEGTGFDRTVFEFGTDTDFPGYKVIWDDTTSARCAEEQTAALGPGRTLLIRFQPAWARKQEGKATSKTVTETSRRPAFPSVASARQLCDDGDKVVWALGAADSTVFRVVQLHTPPRLMVDVAHPGVTIAPAAVDSSAAEPR
jgi:hypothetical protein